MGQRGVGPPDRGSGSRIVVPGVGEAEAHDRAHEFRHALCLGLELHAERLGRPD